MTLPIGCLITVYDEPDIHQRTVVRVHTLDLLLFKGFLQSNVMSLNRILFRMASKLYSNQ